MATLSLFSFLPFLPFLVLLAPPNFVASQWGNPLQSSPPAGSPGPADAPGTLPSQPWGNPPLSSPPAGSPGPAAAPRSSSPPDPGSSQQWGNPPLPSPGPAAAAPQTSSPPNPPQTSSPPNPVSSLKCNMHDEAALLKVKQDWGNPSDLSTWVPGTDCCFGWHYVSCRQDGHVNALDIYISTISAPISAALGDLTALEFFRIAWVPGLTGSIPHSFSRLTNLVDFEIYGTSISGPIPSFISRFSNLTTLSLTINKLSGHIPRSLSKLPKLFFLQLRDNQLCGKIPTGGNMGLFSADCYANNKCLCGTPLPPCRKPLGK